MKTGVVVGAVALAFGAGIVTALLLGQSDSAAPAPPAGAAASAARPPAGPGKVEAVPVSPGGGPAGKTPGGPSGPQGGEPPVTPPGLPPGPASQPPPPPPPPAPGLLREGELAAKEDEAGPGNGKTTHLVYDFETEEQRAEWEASRKASWEVRLKREREIKVRIMREKCGLSAAQEPRLVEILEQEGQERQRLVDALAGKQISRTSFDEQVKANLAKAREALQQLLTPAQYQAYLELKPREQVLRDEAH